MYELTFTVRIRAYIDRNSALEVSRAQDVLKDMLEQTFGQDKNGNDLFEIDTEIPVRAL